MEGTECQLSTGLADRLCGDDTDSLAFLHHAKVRQVASVALGTNAALAFASEDRTDLYALDRRGVDDIGSGIGDFLTGGNDNLSGDRMYDVVDRNTSDDAFAE